MTLKEQLFDEHREITRMANRVVMQGGMQTFNLDITNKWTEVAPSVESIECALNGPDCTVLNVRFGKGGVIPKHKHDRLEEIFVVSGEIYDSVNDVRVTQGDRYIIPKDTPHQIESDNARLTVVFRPPFDRVHIDQS